MHPSSQLTRSLDDVPTELLIQSFADRILVLITQVGKVGNLIQATIPPTAPLLPPTRSSESGTNDAEDTNALLPSPPPSIQLTPLLGSAPTEHIQTLHSLYASQIATQVWLAEEVRGGERKPIVVGISLKKTQVRDDEKERRTFMGSMQMINELMGQGHVEGRASNKQEE